MPHRTYDVFLSHNSRDKPVVRQLKTRLEDQLGPGRVFFDEDAIQPGAVIPERLDQALRDSSSSVVCFGPHGEGPWHEEEIWVSLMKSVELSHKTQGKEDFRLIPVLLPGSDPEQLPLQYRIRLLLDFRNGINDDEATQRLIDRLTLAIQGQPGEIGDTVLRWEDNPYRGLGAFTEDGDDYKVFFGRRRECGELASRLKQERWVVVSGASGNGKSSLVRAGLRTDAAKAACGGIREWTRIRFTPEHDILHSFARAIVEDGAQRNAFVHEMRQSLHSNPPACDATRMLDKLTERFPDRETDRVLIIVDQFEELFTQRLGDAEAEALHARRVAAIFDGLADLLAKASDDPRFFFAFTIREDYRMRLRASPGFWEAFSRTNVNGLQPHWYSLDELDEDALREAIKQPAESLGAYFEPGLVAVIRKDVFRQRGAMPLLQHALSEVWAAAARGKLPEKGGAPEHEGSLAAGACLTYRLYEAVGGVTSSLKQKADQTLRHLANKSHDHDLVCRNLFLRLVNLSDGGNYDTRRTLLRSELKFSEPYATIAVQIIEKLREPATRLLGGGSDVEVTHEALLRECDVIREWIEEARQWDDFSLSQFRQLVDGAQFWEGAKRPNAELWRGKRLSWAAKLLPGTNPAFEPTPPPENEEA